MCFGLALNVLRDIFLFSFSRIPNEGALFY